MGHEQDDGVDLARMLGVDEQLDEIKHDVQQGFTAIHAKLDRIAFVMGLAPFAIGQHVSMKSHVQSWSRYPEVVMAYNESFTKFKNEHGNWKNVADYQ